MTAAIDRTTVATELGKQEIITLTLTSVDRFAGAVTVTPSVVDSAGAALTGVVVTGATTVNLTANAAVPTMYAVKIPTDLSGTDTTATLKLDVTAPSGTTNLTSAFTIAAVYTMAYTAGLAANTLAHPGRENPTVVVQAGTKLMFPNLDTVTHITHGDGSWPHETTGPTGGLPGNTYVVDTAKNKSGDTGNLGCHSHGEVTYAKVTIQ